VSTFALDEIKRPLRLGELLTATIRIYSSRGWTFVPLGVIQAAVLVAVDYIDPDSVSAQFLIGMCLYGLAFTVAFALIARLVAGATLGSAARAVLAAAPVVLALTVVVGMPFALGGARLILLVFSAIWLGLTGFSIPVLMVERAPSSSFLGRLSYCLRRTTTLARVEFWHAVGVVAALLVIYILLGIVVAIAVAGAADLDRTWALAVAQVPLAPFFFIGLSVLYFDQRARALETVAPPLQRAR
jgi:hypothetical protein